MNLLFFSRDVCKPCQRRTQPVRQNLEDFTLPDEWTQTTGKFSELFLLYLKGPESNTRITPLASEIGLCRLATGDIIFMNGTNPISKSVCS